MAMHYRYNAEACRYEPIVVSPKAFAKKTLQFLGISFLIGLAGLFYYNYNFPLLDEVNKLEENQKLKRN